MPRTASATRYAMQVDGCDLVLFAGDFPYDRLPRRLWAATLARLRGAYLNAVTISAPWSWHEPEEGEFDLWGHTCPQRDLQGALSLSAEHGLYVILRPGPHIGGRPDGGIPPWLVNSHPEILALDSQGRPASPGLCDRPISYLHPVYQAYAAGWYQVLLPLLRHFLAGEQGTVVAVEIDNRPSYWWGLQEGDPLAVDYGPWVVGDDGRPGLYQRWLAAQYGDVERLNRRYGRRYAAFAEVQPPRRPPAACHELPWFSDWRRCKMDLVNQHLEYLYDWLREGGVDVPIIVLDPYRSPLAARYCADYFRQRGKPVLVAHAPAGDPALGRVVGTAELARRWVRGTGLPPAGLETPGLRSPEAQGLGVEALCALQLGHGLNALGLTAVHDGAGSREPRTDYAAVRHLGRFLETHGERLVRTEPLADVAFGWYEPYEDCGQQGDARVLGWRDDYRRLLADRFGLAADGEQAGNGGLLDLMAMSGLSYAMLDLQRDALEEWLAFPQLWVLGLDFMAASVQRELISYVRAGGHLVMLPRVPYLDEHLQPCALLDELFPARPQAPPDGQWPSGAVSLNDGRQLRTAGPVDAFDLPPGAEALAWAWGISRPTAYRTAQGRGTATLLGFMPAAEGLPEQQRFVNALADQAQVRRHATSEGHMLHVVERATPAGSPDPAGYLFAINPRPWPVSARLTYTQPRSRRPAHLPRLLKGVECASRSALVLCLETPIPGTPLTIAYATSQVQGWAVDGGRVSLTLYGPPHTMGELALRLAPRADAPAAVRAHPQRLADDEGELVLFTYPHHQGTTILRLQG